MKPPAFEYHRPESVEEAVELLSRLGDDAKLIAGGQSLGPLLNMRLASPEALVDVNRLATLEFVRRGGDDWLEVGALTRQRAVERSELVSEGWPLIAEAMPHVGHVGTRNRGTLGGSLAHADPAAELPAVVTALGGEVTVAGPRGTRTVPVADLWSGFYMTSIDPDEIMLSARVPPPRPRSGSCWIEFAPRHGDYALVGVATEVGCAAGGTVERVRVVLTGVADRVFDASATAERALAGRLLDAEAATSAAAEVADQTEPSSDVLASAGYKRQLVRVLVARALLTAVARIGGDEPV